MMKNYNELLKNYQIKPISYLKKGRSLIIYTKDKKYVLKNKDNDLEIFSYLKNRSFKNYPELLINDDNFELFEYIDEIKIPDEQKFEELIKTVAHLHHKTTYYEKIDTSYNKKIYEDLKNNIAYLKSYYMDIIALIETKEFMSPSEYLFARNYTIITNCLDYANNEIDEWYKSVKDNNTTRIVILHNNLNLNNFISNKLISWRKAKFGSPIFDLLTLFRIYGNKYNFKENLKLYELICPLKNEEVRLLNVFMIMPPKLEFKGREYDMCEILRDKISLLYVASTILPNQFEDSKKNNQEEN